MQLQTAIFVLLAVFALGLFTRVTYVALVLLMTVWTLVRLTHTGVHNWGVMVVALWALLPVRWGADVSLDALIRRRPADNAPSMAHGWALRVSARSSNGSRRTTADQ